VRAWARWFVGGLTAGLLAGSGAFAAASVLSGGSAAPDTDPVVARFVDETLESGVRSVYDGGFTFYVGGGVASFDCDDDAMPDLYLAGGENEAVLVRNTSEPGGALSFEEVSGPETALSGVTGAYPIDIDSDGVTDLAVLRVGENRLLRGEGACRFSDVTDEWSLPVAQDWTAAFSATWEGDNAWPTVAIGNYLEVPPPGEVVRECAPSYLVRPADESAFGPAVPLTPGLCTLSVLFHDWNGTGRADLRMANDRHYYNEGGEQLWRIDPGRAPTLYGESDDWRPLSIWGMGIAVGDVTGDGLPEVVLASQGDNKLQTLDVADRPAYSDIAIKAGTTAHRPFMGDATFPSTAWHPQLADVNNDGALDLYLSKGNVNEQGDHSSDDPSNLMLGRGNATFVESAREAGIVSTGLGRGAALVDLNADGMLDLVEVNRAENVRVWRNVGTGTAEEPAAPGLWLSVRVRQPAPNTDAVGAWVEVRAGGSVQRQQVLVGGGHAGGQLGWLHWGLGSDRDPEVRVTWPDGEEGEWLPVDADTFVVVDRGAQEPRTWTPPGAAP
jgi:hypothetical protein